MRLQEKVAVVTGAAGGIGRETCMLFASEGARVVVVDLDRDACARVASDVSAQGADCEAVAADVSTADGCRQMIGHATKRFGRLDVLFNNAGIMHPRDDNAETTEEDVWDLTMNVNLKGVFLGCKFGIPAMRASGGGSIINTASFVATLGAATPQLAYTASKGGVLSLTRELAVIHAREGIRVNSLSPGPLHTELLMKFLDTEAKRERRLVHIPMGRFGEAREMAKAALFLASDDSSYMTGADLRVDGGITSAYVTPE